METPEEKRAALRPLEAGHLAVGDGEELIICLAGNMLGYNPCMFGRKKRAEGATSKPACEPYLECYREAVDRFGPSFEATLWCSREMQRTRFEVMAAMIDFRGKVIIDAGCGLGDLAEFLCEQGIAYARYVGLEAIEELAAAAAGRGLARGEIVHGDFVSDEGLLGRVASEQAARCCGGRGALVIVFSGSLNTLDEPVARQAVRRAAEAVGLPCCGGEGRGDMSSTGAVVFNFLGDRFASSPVINLGPARRFDTVAMLDWALSITPDAQLRQDYFNGHDATIVMGGSRPQGAGRGE